MSFPRYPTYRDSGVEWLGQVPEHWEVLPLKRVFTTVGDRAEERTFAVALENIQGKTGKLTETEGEFDGDGVAFRAGDILYGKLRPYLAKVWLADRAGEAVGDFHVLRPTSEVEPAFFRDFLLTPSIVSVLNGSTYGAKMPRVSWDFMGAMAVARPPVREQRIITDFLDRETSKIDSVVEKQQTLLKQLEEKRAATISHVVTKGLDPSVPMKDSGVEWLGRVPAHWDVFQARRLFRLIDDVTEDGTGELLTVSHLTGVSRRSEKSVNMFEAEDKEGYRQVVAGDLIINTMWAWMGAMGVAPEDGIVSPAYTVYRPKADSFLPTYVAGLVRSRHLITEMTRYSKGIWSSRLRLYASEFFQLRLPRPPVEEQQRIAEFLEKHLSESEALAAKARKNIALLRERRAALISAAVTGRIDVRGTAKPATKVGEAA